MEKNIVYMSYNLRYVFEVHRGACEFGRRIFLQNKQHLESPCDLLSLLFAAIGVKTDT